MCHTGLSAAECQLVEPARLCGWTAGCLCFAPCHWLVFGLDLGQSKACAHLHPAQIGQTEQCKKCWFRS